MTLPPPSVDAAVPHAYDEAPAYELAAENHTLRETLKNLVDQAEYNHQIMRRHQAFDLQIVGANSFTELISCIIHTLPQIAQLDIVTLTLLDQGGDIHHVMLNQGVDFSQFPQLIFVEEETELGEILMALHKATMGLFHAPQHRQVFPDHLITPASVAIVPLLRNKKLIGSLNLGSLDPGRFTVSLGTDFIEHMASIIAISLENVISNELLKYISLTDPLTGVHNRRYIDRRLLEEIGRAKRQGYSLSCMYIDIDHFKQINDSVGHQGGDDVLRELAIRIKAELRLSDALSRFGGEEFVVLLIDARSDAACMVAERIRLGIANRPFKLKTGQYSDVTVSIGVATLNASTGIDQAAPIETVALQFIEQADHALYQAKKSGRNRVICAKKDA